MRDICHEQLVGACWENIVFQFFSSQNLVKSDCCKKWICSKSEKKTFCFIKILIFYDFRDFSWFITFLKTGQDHPSPSKSRLCADLRENFSIFKKFRLRNQWAPGAVVYVKWKPWIHRIQENYERCRFESLTPSQGPFYDFLSDFSPPPLLAKTTLHRPVGPTRPPSPHHQPVPATP